MLRKPAVAGLFYPADSRAARESVTACFLHGRQTLQGIERAVPARFGLVPHAGWVYSGATAAVTFQALSSAQTAVRSVIVLGAVHRGSVRGPALFGPGAWETPLGALTVDDELASAVTGIDVIATAHNGEHAIEVQLPFIQLAFPDARFVPIAVTPDARAIAVGERIADAIRERPDVVVIASSDLTHYGPSYDFAPRGLGAVAHAWAKQNDDEILDAARNLDAIGVLRHAAMNQSACGPGALAALVVIAQRCGTTNVSLLAHTTSHEVASGAAADPRIRRDAGEPSDFVGYASMVFG
ncbi:MAG: AmmeMemoRadiSam system protein B [Deltaproteobacteria bacterium]|nr:AmmeMemoRadiSam system protein B [Deltaproteobacteria bacterium]